MNLTHDAMLVSLRITAWSGRLYDRQASNHVAAHHDASASAGRYNKRLLPKAAFAALTTTISKIRSTHYEQTLPWDDQGSRMLTVANYERYTELLDGLRERMVRERARFIEDYDDNIDQARLDLGRLFRIEDYPSKEALQGRFGIRYGIVPVPDADHFMAQLASDDTARVKRDIESQIEERLHEAVGDLYRRLGEAVERVSERLPGRRGRQTARLPQLDDREHPRSRRRGAAPQHIRGRPPGAALPGREGPHRPRRSGHAPPVAAIQPERAAPGETRRRCADPAVRRVFRRRRDGRPGGGVMPTSKLNRIRRNLLFNEVPDRRDGHREAESTTALATAAGLSRIVAWRLLAELEAFRSIQSTIERVNGRAVSLWWRGS